MVIIKYYNKMVNLKFLKVYRAIFFFGAISLYPEQCFHVNLINYALTVCLTTFCFLIQNVKLVQFIIINHVKTRTFFRK